MRAVIFCWVGNQGDNVKRRLRSQEVFCRRFCQRNGITVDAVFHDACVGGNVDNRPKLDEMLEHCRRRKSKLDYVVVWKRDGIASKKNETYAVRVVLGRYGILVRSATERESGHEIGDLLERIAVDIGQYEKDKRGREIKAGIRASRRCKQRQRDCGAGSDKA